MRISEFVEAAKKGNINIIEHTKKALKEAEKINEEYHYITAWADVEQQAEQLQKRQEEGNATGKLFGVLISVKDDMCVKGIESCASSAILKGYKPLFNATAVERCIREGAIILGKTVQDEFGFGTFGDKAGIGYKKPKNPVNKKHFPGGSSSGAGGLTKLADFPHLSLAESTGGSTAAPASFCGVIGITPTYGRVSRYGLIDYANSMDKICTMARTVEDAALLLEIISGQDEHDSTSAPEKVPQLTDIPANVNGIKIGIIKEAFEGADNHVRKQVLDAVYQLEQKGARKIEISLPITMKYGLAAYYVLAMCEASTNLAKYCGMRYGQHEKLSGNYNEYFSRVRTQYFGEEVKRRILLGTFARMAGYRDAFYTKAAQVRTKIIEEYNNVFSQVDVIITPTMPITAPTAEEVKKLTPLQHYLMDVITAPINLAGLPHINVPCGQHNEMPIGMLITGKHFAEAKIIQVAKAVENNE
ncbi:Asp-tRNA(Asn)/Glu-tRNA(Gln) amidotransferase GatCAB subunit A [Candidatus Woesearchaeota archaeon CG10_big_fil_rev_8_21_14_0_10_37_12]|nr:MAG: Asp-tRNA(Asn)/Glu-tRNA(Gln) amidotransferase GatCAB subunit A [Candidatus Woesearchaeota archaeon CG10_big_fil_rev_8_21_14_0_10_37_12]